MFETFTSIVLVIVFLVPGYIWRSVESEFFYLYHRLPWEKFALGLLTRSTITYLPFTLLLYRGWNRHWYDSHPVCTTFALIFFILIYPAICGSVVGIAKQSDWLGAVARWRFTNWLLSKVHFYPQWYLSIPTAWEAVFNSKLKACCVIVTRKNGAQVYGILDEESHISVDPEDRDLFISRTLYLNQETKKYEFVPGTKGVYIHADEISTIELIEFKPEEPTGNEK